MQTVSTTMMRVHVAPYTIVFAEPDGARVGRIAQAAEVRVIGDELIVGNVSGLRVEHDGRRGYVKASHLAAASPR